MVKLRFQKIIWNEYVKKHIKKHGVSIEEVEEVIRSDVLIKERYSGRKILAQRIGTRLLAVIVIMSGNKVFVVTARDANDKERQDYYEDEENRKSRI